MNKEIEYTNENVISTSRYITLYADKLKNIINLLSVDADVRNFLISGNEDSKKKGHLLGRAERGFGSW